MNWFCQGTRGIQGARGAKGYRGHRVGAALFPNNMWCEYAVIHDLLVSMYILNNMIDFLLPSRELEVIVAVKEHLEQPA